MKHVGLAFHQFLVNDGRLSQSWRENNLNLDLTPPQEDGRERIQEEKSVKKSAQTSLWMDAWHYNQQDLFIGTNQGWLRGTKWRCPKDMKFKWFVESHRFPIAHEYLGLGTLGWSHGAKPFSCVTHLFFILVFPFICVFLLWRLA